MAQSQSGQSPTHTVAMCTWLWGASPVRPESGMALGLGRRGRVREASDAEGTRGWEGGGAFPHGLLLPSPFLGVRPTPPSLAMLSSVAR